MKKAYLVLIMAVMLVVVGVAMDGYSNSASAQDNSNDRQRPAVDRSVTNIDNGVIIELTSSDPDVVKRIQERKETRRGGGGNNCDSPKAERTVKNIKDGVRITITSDDPDTVSQIQEKAKKRKRGRKGRGGGKGNGGGNGNGGGRGNGQGRNR
jgi:TusA-related sulfurtransferase